MMEKRHVDLQNRELRFKIGEDKTSGKTGRPRVIHLNDTALAMVRSYMALYPTDPLLRNSRGKPWTDYAINCAVRKARLKAGLGDNLAVAYAVRHQYITVRPLTSSESGHADDGHDGVLRRGGAPRGGGEA